MQPFQDDTNVHFVNQVVPERRLDLLSLDLLAILLTAADVATEMETEWKRGQVLT